MNASALPKLRWTAHTRLCVWVSVLSILMEFTYFTEAKHGRGICARTSNVYTKIHWKNRLLFHPQFATLNVSIEHTHTHHHPRPDAWSGSVWRLIKFTSFYFHFSKRRIECQRATPCVEHDTELCRQRNEPEIEYFVGCQRTYFCTWMDDNEHISILSLARTICENGKFSSVLCYRVNSQLLEGMHICGYHFQFWIFDIRGNVSPNRKQRRFCRRCQWNNWTIVRLIWYLIFCTAYLECFRLVGMAGSRF